MTARLIPPKDGAVVRMYRIGHGDCFLIALAGEADNEPAYILIDCGYKPGSTKMIRRKAGVADTASLEEKFPTHDQPTIREIVANIQQATGGNVNVAIVTHEHQDHVNAITASNFAGLKIGETWLAWTEDPTDDLANKLRKEFNDQLLGLLAARNRIAAPLDAAENLGASSNNTQAAKRLKAERAKLNAIDDLLAFELGGDDETPFSPEAARAALLNGLGATAGASMNKTSIKLFKDKATNGVRYIKPHEGILKVPGAKNARAYPLGPPHDSSLLETLDPQGDEEFQGIRFSAGQSANFLLAALGADKDAADDVGSITHHEGWASPFAAKYRVPLSEAATSQSTEALFNKRYNRRPDYQEQTVLQLPVSPPEKRGKDEIAGDAAFRRIDTEWLSSAGQIALDMNDQTNNASLVLAFELGPNGKVLLFAADAQRGNWLSWNDKTFADNDNLENGTPRTVTARDLLGRTVLYKVGHHGSHNATLNGKPEQDWANLSWMAQGVAGREFTALITAVRAWAETQKGWDHPLKAIKDALLQKAAGRVFQTDTDFELMKKPDSATELEWKAFKDRCVGDRLYFDITISP